MPSLYRIMKIEKATNYCIGYLPTKDAGEYWLPLGVDEDKYELMREERADNFIRGSAADKGHMYVKQWAKMVEEPHREDI